MIPQTKIEQAAKRLNPFLHPMLVEGFNSGMTAGVRFAESEMGQAQTFEIACVCAKMKIEFKDGKLKLISAVDGWGDALDPDQIIITKHNHENES